jgi:hypothetical protein
MDIHISALFIVHMPRRAVSHISKIKNWKSESRKQELSEDPWLTAKKSLGENREILGSTYRK